MHDHFRVAVGLEDRAAMLELSPPLRRIRQIAIMPQRNFALVAIDHDRLGIQQSLIARSGIARVPNCQVAAQSREHSRLKNFFHFSHGTVQMQIRAVAGNDSSRLLSTMLQRVETQIRQLRGFLMAEYAKYTTFVVKVIVEMHEVNHLFDCVYRTFNACSSELDQPSRRFSSGPSITALPLYWMRN